MYDEEVKVDLTARKRAKISTGLTATLPTDVVTKAILVIAITLY